MVNKFQYFDIDITINDKRDVRGLILDNKIKVVLISDPEINRSICSVGIGAGYLQDVFEGTAHFLEHLLFMGSEKYPKQNEYTSYIQTCGGTYNAFTSDNMTVYYLELDTSFFKKGVEMLSWFFKKPILDMKHINSEREIINSEHEKNILNDTWIMDDIFKNFIKSKNKYNNFGTGNSVSLKDITKEDIMDFYNKYYTTDNTYVCIIDTKPIDIMIKEYIGFFDDISDNSYKKENERFPKEEIHFEEDNLVIFKSVTEYNFFNIYNIFKCDGSNQIDYQLINLINFLIGSEYIDSISYFLKENKIIKNISSSVDYFYDFNVNINTQFLLNNPSIEHINIIVSLYNDLLNEMSLIEEKDFQKIYENFQKINLLKCVYSDEDKNSNYSISIIENLIKSEPKYAILRKNIVPQYNKKIYERFIEIIDTIDIKIITNINYQNITNFKISKWYKTKYFMTNFKFPIKIKSNYKINLLNSIGIKDFFIKTNIFNKNIDKNEYPKLVNSDKNIKRDIYYLEKNKYNQPIASITILRKNSIIKDKYNKLIFSIYCNLCIILLQYYLETMSNYKMYCSIDIYEDNISLNFNGLEYLLNNYIFEIIKVIHPDSIILNPNLEKKFNTFIIDIIEHFSNSKYDSPYIKCIDVNKILLNNNMFPEEAIKFLKKLTFNEFKKKIVECFKYEYEYFIIVGIEKDNSSSNNNCIIDENINYIIESLSLNPKKYLIKNQYNEPEFKLDLDFIFKKSQINSDEQNNCVLHGFIMNCISIENDNKFIKKEIVYELLKNKLVYQITSNIINEPLFDQIRTIDKLGYIVKSDFISQNFKNKVIMIVYFLVQSTYDIKLINKSIDKFIIFLKNDIKNNKNTYIEKFSSLKKSKILSFDKSFIDLDEEVSTYASSILEKYGIFNINQVLKNICKKIKFKDFIQAINKIINSKENYRIIFNKNI